MEVGVTSLRILSITVYCFPYFFPRVYEREFDQGFLRTDCDIGDLFIWNLGVGIKGLWGQQDRL